MENRRIQRPTLKIRFKPYLALRGRIFSIANAELIEYIQSLLESNPFVEESNFVDVDSFYIENIAKEEDDLYSFLMHQVNMLELEDLEKEIAEHIISNLDEAGFLRASIEEIAERSQSDSKKVKEVLSIVQSLDPPGIASRNLTECFINQLEREEKLGAKLKKIISCDLEDFVKLPLKKAAKKFGISEEDIISMRERIQNLNPSPGYAFMEPKEIVKVPDLIVDQLDDGFNIYLNKAMRKEFAISKNHQLMLKNIEDKVCKKEFEELLNQAMWSKQALESRDNLLLEIGKRIIARNHDFFLRRKNFPEKYSLEEFAKELKIEYSALSRLIQNKYIKCPRGILPLHFFIKHKLTIFNDEEVKSKIKEIVDKEEKNKPFTDKEIEEILKQEGIRIKRRTIAKYRSILKIPSASKRRLD